MATHKSIKRAVNVSPHREFWDPQKDTRRHKVCFTPFGGSTAVNVLDYYPVELGTNINVSSCSFLFIKSPGLNLVFVSL